MGEPPTMAGSGITFLYAEFPLFLDSRGIFTGKFPGPVKSW